MRSRLVQVVDDPARSEEVLPTILAAATTGALVSAEAADEIAKHSRLLVCQNYVLIGLTGALAALTVVLIARTFP